MVKIEALVSPGRLDDVKRALGHQWVDGLTVTELKGSRSGRVVRYRGAAGPAELSPLLRVEIVIPTPLLPRLLDDLARWLREGRTDDGLLSAVPVLEAVRVRTGERGEGAL